MTRFAKTVAVAGVLLAVAGVRVRHDAIPEAAPEPSAHLGPDPVAEAGEIRGREARGSTERLRRAAEETGRESTAARRELRKLLDAVPLHPTPPTSAGPDPDALPPGAVARLGSAAFRNVSNIAVSPDGKRLALTNGIAASVYELPSLKLLRHLPYPDPHRWFNDFRFLDDRLLLGETGSGTHLFNVWDVDTGALARLARQGGKDDANGHVLRASSAMLSDDARLFVVPREGDRPPFGFDVWQTFPLKRLHTIWTIQTRHVWARLSVDGSALLCGGERRAGPDAPNDHLLQVFDTGTGRERARIDPGQYPPGPDRCAIGPDGTRVAVVSFSTGLTTFDTRTGESVPKIPLADKWVYHLHFDRGGRLLVAGETTLRVLEPASGREVARYDLLKAAGVYGFLSQRGRVEFPQDGPPLACTSGWMPQVLELETGRPLLPQAGHGTAVTALRFSTDGRQLRAADREGSFLAWDVAKCVPGRPFPRSLVKTDRRGTNGFPAFDGDGSRLFLGVTEYGVRQEDGISGFDTATGEKLFFVGPLPERLYGGDNARPVFNPSGTAFAVESRTVRHLRHGVAGQSFDFPVRDAKTGKPVVAFPVKDASSACASFSADGHRLLVVTDHPNRRYEPVQLNLFDLRTKELVRHAALSTGGPATPLPTPDGRRAVLVQDHIYMAHGGIRDYPKTDTRLASWNLETGEVRELGGAKYGGRLAEPMMSPCGRWFALVTLGDYQDGPFPVDAFDGTRSAGQTVRVFETATLTQRFEWSWPIPRHDELAGLPEALPDREVHSLALSPDGRTLAAGMASGTILLCDVSPRAGPKPWEMRPTGAAELWERLADPDAAKAWPAMRELSGRPDAAVALFRERVRPVFPADKPTAERLARLMDGLSSRDFRERETATAALAALGRLIEPELRQVRKRVESPEAQARLERLLGRLADDTADERREARAVEVLESADGAVAHTLLREWAKAAGSTALGREAANAVARATKR